MWNSGDAYEQFMGRWSRIMAPRFLQWLEPPPGLLWLDLGCGTGALSEAILAGCRPAQLTGVDPSPAFLEKAAERLAEKAVFIAGSASAIPLPDASIDIVASGLALNFFPDLPAALQDVQRVLLPGGTLAAFVWDYSSRGMEFLQLFWEAAEEEDAAARASDEGARYAICHPDALRRAFEAAGFGEIVTARLTIDTVFRDFDDYWQPFFGGQGPGPAYLATLSAERQEAIRSRLQQKLTSAPDGSIPLQASAIAIRSTRH